MASMHNISVIARMRLELASKFRTVRAGSGSAKLKHGKFQYLMSFDFVSSALRSARMNFETGSSQARHALLHHPGRDMSSHCSIPETRELVEAVDRLCEAKASGMTVLRPVGQESRKNPASEREESGRAR